MASIPFFKYQGAGNDFILIDDREGNIDPLFSRELIEQWCDRRFGIGADGLILLQKTKDGDGYFMKYYNSDGRQSTFCGNGGRCFVSFASKLGVSDGEFLFLGTDGLHRGMISPENLIILSMSDVKEVQVLDDHSYTLYTGSPHYVSFVDDVEAVDVFEKGRAVRNSDMFINEGINVNFVQSENASSIHIRTYERGVEDETYACGTGVVASAIANAIRHNEYSGDCSVHAKGGQLRVTFDRNGNHDFTNVKLIGPAKEVFSGKIEL